MAEEEKVIVLKALAREFDPPFDPYRLRQVLRAEFGKVRKRRWTWKEGDKELAKIRTFLKGKANGKA